MTVSVTESGKRPVAPIRLRVASAVHGLSHGQLVSGRWRRDSDERKALSVLPPPVHVMTPSNVPAQRPFD